MGNKLPLMLRDEEVKQLSDESGFSATQVEKLYSRFAHLDRTNLGSLSRSDLMSIPELAINPLCERLIHLFFTECNQDGRGLVDEEDDEARINFRQFVKVLAAFRSSSSPSSTSFSSTSSTSSASPPQAVRQESRLPSRVSSNHTGRLHSKGSTRAQLVASERQARVSLTGPTMNESLRDKLLFVFKIYDADNDGRISFGDLRSILKLMVGNYIEDVQLDKIATRAFVEVDQDGDGFVEFGEFCRVFAGKDLDDKLRVKFFS